MADEPVPDGLEVILVAAVADNGVIGTDEGMPWHYPEDLRHFKETTIGHPVILGRRTFERILDRLGEPLPGRTNVVLSRGDPDLPDEAVVLAGGIEEALAAAAERDDVAFVVGGGTIYEAYLPLADRMVITEIHEPHEGTVRFPDWDPDEWEEVERDERDEFDFVTYERVDG